METNKAKKRFFWLVIVLMLGTFFAGVTVTLVSSQDYTNGIGYFVVCIALYLAAWSMMQRVNMKIEIEDNDIPTFEVVKTELK